MEINKLTHNEFLENIQKRVFGDYIEIEEGCGHNIDSSDGTLGNYKDSLYNKIYGSMLTFIEAISDKDTVEQRKSIVKQMLRNIQGECMRNVRNYMKYTELVDVKFRDKKNGKIIKLDMMFINDYSDGGSASLGTVLENIEKDYEIIK